MQGPGGPFATACQLYGPLLAGLLRRQLAPATTLPLPAVLSCGHHRMCLGRILSGENARRCFYPDSPLFHRKAAETLQAIKSYRVFGPGCAAPDGSAAAFY
jgi:hypothetical protein